MNYGLTDFLVFTLCAAISSMGMGGGGLLILYLISVKAIPQLYAQGINLLFFIPCSALSIIVYIKNGFIKPKKILPMLFGGIVGALIGSVLIKHIRPDTLRMIFAVFLIASGAFMIFFKDKRYCTESENMIE